MGVVSKTFTAYDNWVDPGGTAVCTACAWAFRGSRLRLASHLVTRQPTTLRELTSTQAADVLTNALPPDHALIVPLHPGRKHLLPTARWGRVTIEDAQLSWTETDTQRLDALHRLRTAGFGPRMLRSPAPAWTVLQRLPNTCWPDVDEDWRLLATWRTRPLWLDLALTVTNTARTGAEVNR